MSERARSDKGRYMSAEEAAAFEREKTDAAMNRWIISRVRGTNSKQAMWQKKFGFGPKKESKQ